MKRTQKGFTLIELLVVIAVIGLLSTLTMVSLGGVRNRANDAAVSSSMHQLQVSTEIYNSENNSYAGLDAVCLNTNPTTACPAAAGTNRDVCTLCKDIDQKNGGTNAYPILRTNAAGDAYCAYALAATSTAANKKWYCIDNTGRATGLITNDPADVANTECNGTSYVCP